MRNLLSKMSFKVPNRPQNPEIFKILDVFDISKSDTFHFAGVPRPSKLGKRDLVFSIV